MSTIMEGVERQPLIEFPAGFRPTVGIELEITESAQADTPAVADREDPYAFHDEDDNLFLAEELGVYLGADEIYEMSSKPNDTPLAMGHLMRRLVGVGWLPSSTEGSVPMHINLGIPPMEDKMRKLYPAFLNILRVVELCDGASPERLEEAFWEAEKADIQKWVGRGIGGVSLSKAAKTDKDNAVHPVWEGENDRVELRTPEYIDLTQAAGAVELAYYLTAGAMSEPDSSPNDIYGVFIDFTKPTFAIINCRLLKQRLPSS